MNQLLFFLLVALSFQASGLELKQWPTEAGIRHLLIVGELMDSKQEVAKQLHALATQQKMVPTLVRVNFTGGRILESEAVGATVIQLAQAHREKLGVPLQVQIASSCYSACTLWLAMWSQAQAQTGDLSLSVRANFGVGFHMASVNGAPSAIAQRLYENRMRAYGVNGDWFQFRQELFQSTKFAIVTAQDLCGDGSNILRAENCVPQHTQHAELRVSWCAKDPRCELAAQKVQTHFGQMNWLAWALATLQRE